MRFYAEPSEYPRVIDRRTGKCVWSGLPVGYDSAVYVAEALNRIWERDVAFVSEWLRTRMINPEYAHESFSQTWEREMADEFK